MSKREPRFDIVLNMTFDEYLGLLWHLQGLPGCFADKQTVTKLARLEKSIHQRHAEWRAKNFKCARGGSR